MSDPLYPLCTCRSRIAGNICAFINQLSFISLPLKGELVSSLPGRKCFLPFDLCMIVKNGILFSLFIMIKLNFSLQIHLYFLFWELTVRSFALWVFLLMCRYLFIFGGHQPFVVLSERSGFVNIFIGLQGRCFLSKDPGSWIKGQQP